MIKLFFILGFELKMNLKLILTVSCVFLISKAATLRNDSRQSFDFLAQISYDINIPKMLEENLPKSNVTTEQLFSFLKFDNLTTQQRLDLFENYFKMKNVEEMKHVLQKLNISAINTYKTLTAPTDVSKVMSKILNIFQIDTGIFYMNLLVDQNETLFYQQLSEANLNKTNVEKAKQLLVNSTDFLVKEMFNIVTRQLKNFTISDIVALGRVHNVHHLFEEVFKIVNISEDDIKKNEKMSVILNSFNSKIDNGSVIGVLTGNKTIMSHISIAKDYLANMDVISIKASHNKTIYNISNVKISNYLNSELHTAESFGKPVQIAVNVTEKNLKNCYYIYLDGLFFVEVGVNVSLKPTLSINKSKDTIYTPGGPLLCGNDTLYGMARQEDAGKIFFDSISINSGSSCLTFTNVPIYLAIGFIYKLFGI